MRRSIFSIIDEKPTSNANFREYSNLDFRSNFRYIDGGLFLPAVLITFWGQIHPWIRIGSLLFIFFVILIVVGLRWVIRSSDDIFKKQLIKPDSHVLDSEIMEGNEPSI